MTEFNADFHLPKGHYLLSHSVGRMLRSAAQDYHQHFVLPWQSESTEPWPQWLKSIERFQGALAQLLNSQPQWFCPQANLSSGLSKWLMSLPESNLRKVRVLMSEDDFPSMGFVFQQALDNVEVVFIPAHLDMHDSNVWQEYINEQIDWVFISHVYSNSGEQAPVKDIITLAKQSGCRTIVDIAQSLCVLPIDLTQWQADCVIGSSVKWSCGGPGAGFLWVHPDVLPYCEPKDVGWFSHQNPFEFDIHHFAFHDTALRFWGGTPSVAPFVYAGHSLDYFARLGINTVRAHNLKLLTRLQTELAPFYRSPVAAEQCSGTAILDFAEHQETVSQALQQAQIATDQRRYGLRVSPHIYNTEADIKQLIAAVNSVLAT